jgi:hypothetical protein
MPVKEPRCKFLLQREEEEEDRAGLMVRRIDISDN